MPIRKVTAERAALTSYYGKIFIQRSPLAKNNYTAWLAKVIRATGLDAKDDRVTAVQFGSNDLPKKELPRDYSALTQALTKFTSGDYTFFLDYKNREKAFTPELTKKAEKNNRVVCGSDSNKNLLTMDANGTIYLFKDNKFEPLGKLLDVIGGEWGRIPSDYAEMMIFGKRVPMALILGYYNGLTKLLKSLKAEVRTEPANQRSFAAEDELMLQFKDEKMYVKKTDPVIALTLQGLAALNKTSRLYNLSEFDKKDVYGPMLSSGFGITQMHIRELDLIYELFLDPITIDVLKEMKEPTDVIPLMRRCIELIATDAHPDEADRNFMRRRGLERISGFVYKAMVGAIREQRNKPNPSIHPVYMGPRDVWMAVNEDPTVQLVKELNPIHTLKEQEAVSLSGEGGRSAVSLVKKSRVFHQTDVGQIAEATPDSGKVGVRTSMPPNAKLSNLYGMTGKFDFEKDGSTSVMSTTALLMPASNHDDGKLKYYYYMPS